MNTFTPKVPVTGVFPLTLGQRKAGHPFAQRITVTTNSLPEAIDQLRAQSPDGLVLGSIEQNLHTVWRHDKRDRFGLPVE